MAHHKLLGSSIDPNKIALSIKSAVPFVIFLLAMFKLDIPENLLYDVATTLGIVITGCFTLYGLGRKIYLRFKK